MRPRRSRSCERSSGLIVDRCSGRSEGSDHDCADEETRGAEAWQWQAVPKDAFHVLRHTCAFLVPEAGEPVVALAEWPGHSSSAIALDHYAHFVPEAGKKGRRTIDDPLRGSGETEGPGADSPDSPRG